MNGFGTILKDYLEFHDISQSDFANRLNITFKHMNEILNENTDISIDLMIAISLLTDINPNEILEKEQKKKMYNYLNSKFKTEKEINNYLNNFYIKDIHKLGWITLKDEKSYVQNAIDLLEYLNIRNFDILEEYFNQRFEYNKNNTINNKKIMIWTKRCDALAQRQQVTKYNSSNLKELLEKIKTMTKEPFDSENLIKLFNKYGIKLVIEETLKETKINACTLVKGTTPTIYIDKKIKDKAQFYFVLYHELSKIKSDYNKLKKKINVYSQKDSPSKQDNFALNMMVENKIYEQIKKDIYNIIPICEKNNIPVSFAHYILKKDGIINTKTNEYNLYQENI